MNEQTKRTILKKLENHLSKTDACIQAGVARATFYRELFRDSKFAREVQFAQASAIDLVDDTVTSKIIEKIEAGDMRAISMWSKIRPQKKGLAELSFEQAEKISKHKLGFAFDLQLEQIKQSQEDMEELCKKEA